MINQRGEEERPHLVASSKRTGPCSFKITQNWAASCNTHPFTYRLSAVDSRIMKINLDFHSLFTQCVRLVCVWHRRKWHLTQMTSSVIILRKQLILSAQRPWINPMQQEWHFTRLLLTQQWLRTGIDWLALLHLSEHCYNHCSSLE